MTDPRTTPAREGENIAEFTVSELSNAIKRALEENFGHVRLRGEVSGYRGPHNSGHCYFALKDDKTKIEAVIWRSAWSRLKFKPEEGMEVVAVGKISSFPGSSKYQIVIDSLEPAGIGALMVKLEERKKRFAAEGLFDEARKKARPFLPSVVGIVTSPTGAVIRDMLHGFAERFPTRVIVWPVRVQGEGSADEVAAAVRGFNALVPGGAIPRPDVLIVARGGGSLEDLWGFNEEVVVRAVAASAIPVISAVGHETDWTLIDLVADARAPTPTKAAEWAVPKHSDLTETTGKLGLRHQVAMRRLLEAQRRELKAAERGLPRPEDLVSLPRQRFDSAAGRLDAALRARVQSAHTRFAQIAGQRLARALTGNTQAHHARHIRIASRLSTRLLEARFSRARDRLESTGRRSCEALARAAATRRARLERTSGRLQPAPLRYRIERCEERLEALKARARRALLNANRERYRTLDGQAKLLASLSYQSVLARGYALVRNQDGVMVRAAAGVARGDFLDIQLKDGRIGAQALSGGAPPRATIERPPHTPPHKRRGGSGQGSLF